MTREFSAGGIIFNNRREVLIINNAALRDPAKSYWGFPKGHIEKGESSENAALREVEEETGLKTEIIQKLGDSRYVYVKSKERIFKVVVYFLMKHIAGKAVPQKGELLGIKWCKPEKALERLSFPKDKEFLKKALKFSNCLSL